MKQLFSLLIFFSMISSIVAQELSCLIDVNSRQVEGSERTMFENMQRAIFELVNGQKWTREEYEPEERIECSILINLEERVSANEYRGNIQIQASRPIYNTSYKSPIVNIRDENFTFQYNQFEPLQFTQGTYSGELAQVLAYYVYIILGYDHDSFAPEGGTVYFQQAQRIVADAQNSKYEGWQAFQSQRNRYWLVDNILSPRFKPMRKMFYTYHRRGFDLMSEDVVRARNTISQSLKALRPIHSVAPASYNMQVLFNAKMQEVVELFSNATPQEKQEISELLIIIDPGNANNYEKIRNSK